MGWSKKYKRSIDCNNPKGFSQKAHCAGRKKKENVMSSKLEELVGKRLTEEQFDEAAGKKDACYHKVKARYDVWPSAYASGALVKCRKVGAKNWGNKSKKEGLDDLKALPKDLKKSIKKNREESINEDKAKVLKLLIKRGNNPQDAKSDVEKLYNKVNKMYKNASNSKKAEIISALSAKMESVNEAIKKWNDVPKSGTLDFGKYGRYVILSKNDLRVSGRFVSGSNKGKKVIWYSDKGKTYYRKRRGLKMSQTPSFPFDMVKESLSEKKNDYIVIGKNRKGKPIKVTKDKTKKYGIGGVVMTKSQYKKRPDYDKKRIKGVDHILTKVGKRSVYLPIVFESVNEARGTCWVGYQQLGMKKKGGKMVPNCVKEIIEIYYEQNGEGHGYTFEHIKDLKLNEAEYQGRKVKLGKIMQGDTKKFKVYVKNPKGNVVKVNFGQGGDAKGGTMRIRKSNPKARKSFRARHNCDNPGPRHKARYWSCRKW